MSRSQFVRFRHMIPLLVVVATALGCSNTDGEPSADHSSHSTDADAGSGDIEGLEVKDYPAGKHVEPTQRVAYDESPPFGGPHDQVWAACTGIVYPEAIRTENIVHSLEHGAVWIAYNPDDVSGSDLESLAGRVDGTPYTLLSPYPDLDAPISLQAWGRRLKLDNADDPRIDAFIEEFRMNRETAPEPGASCAAYPGAFDPDNPPPFDSSPLPADAVPVG
ncbi:DUF3105 domain-containing protein [Antrihabitans sp. YC2-6]|uniref:DUF3105 domain-containing protein n=1 Tax=Antrihabitans sp. YC2-6 TaxID=2799498 RepID=UPI0027DDCF3F|nr:DUF3105 domain-containing protein [Antrihabitans sp. YC2-6]